MIKSISFIVLTQFLHFNDLKIKASYLFFKLNQQYFFTVYIYIYIYIYASRTLYNSKNGL